MQAEFPCYFRRELIHHYLYCNRYAHLDVSWLSDDSWACRTLMSNPQTINKQCRQDMWLHIHPYRLILSNERRSICGVKIGAPEILTKIYPTPTIHLLSTRRHWLHLQTSLTEHFHSTWECFQDLSLEYPIMEKRAGSWLIVPILRRSHVLMEGLNTLKLKYISTIYNSQTSLLLLPPCRTPVRSSPQT